MDAKASNAIPTVYPSTPPYSKGARSSHQYFSLRWNNYQSNMTSVFHELLETQSFVDVTLACEYNSLKAHKVVLSACSAYFQKILLDNPCKHPTIILPSDICFSDLQFIIEFVYRGEIDVSEAELQDIIPELDTAVHAEALTYILLLLKNEQPSTELVKCLLSRESKNRADAFVISVLRCWCENYEEKLSEIIAGLLQSKYPASSPNKRKRPLKSSPLQHCTPSSEQILYHLEHFRRSCRHGNGTGTGLYVQNEMQRSLQQAFAHSTDSQKKHFADLFALAAEDETSASVGRRSTSSRGRKPPASKKDSTTSISSSKKNLDNTYASDDSTDEDWSKQKSGKRRKKTFSDSD